MRLTPSAVLTSASLLTWLLAAALAGAVEVRQPSEPPSYVARLARAYAPCLAPNTATGTGVPACSPPVSSACPFFTAEVTVTPEFGTPRVNAFVHGTGDMDLCEGTYFLDLAVRVSGNSGDCASGACTYQDAVHRFQFDDPFELNDQRLDVVLPPEITERSYQILGATIIAPDGLPLATTGATGIARFPATLSNLSVPYEACTSPDPGKTACSIGPWSSVCDFNSGALTWRSLDADHSNAPRVHATLRGLAGSSPLCTTGTYRVDATVRPTAPICGGQPCTLVDQHVSVPFAADGHDVDGETTVAFSPQPVLYDSVQLLDFAVTDPLGATIAAADVNQVRNLAKPRINIAPDRLRIQATFPLPFLVTQVLDPTQADGLTLTLTDRNGVIYAVTIPPERWQVQPPIGTRWDYKDKGGVLGGVRTARLKLTNSKAAPGYSFKLDAKGIDLSGADFPGITINLSIPGVPSGVFQAQAHRTCRIKGTKMDCR